ncbi:MAG TPA: protein-L-isoaspartate(D-aspartate) O-methyltransferase [Pirellulales bacterium]|jgi:protein-L-isoaspartate(D-aspartate) O-methyltransferase|nr:protein-L-isoaspartate(D-aspartate) O-methyltransferase [Pirellulales bacterium]
MAPGIALHRQVGFVLVAALLLIANRCRAKDFAVERNRMVDEEIVAAGVKDPRVIKAMRDTPRHEFVALSSRGNAYFDMALPIGERQTISPPFIVAYMTEQLLPQPNDIVLEIGTGSGYQAAVLSPLVKEVYTIEIVKPLGDRAKSRLKRLKYANVQAKVGDGYQGWPEHAPFDKIIVTCSPDKVPPQLVEQLREGGRMIVPEGERFQQTLYLFQKKDGKLTKAALLPVLFVPMTGKAEEGRQVQPDPANPAIHNGGFEEVVAAKNEPGSPESVSANPGGASDAQANSEPTPAGWYYQRQLKLVDDKSAPEGTHYVTFSNSQSGRGAQALQGLAVDGRKVDELNVSLFVKAKDIRQGETKEQLPVMAITFYDDNRGQTGYTWVGPWRDSFAWQKVTDRVRVPPKAREAIVRIGMHGATGEISFDDIRIEAVK